MPNLNAWFGESLGPLDAAQMSEDAALIIGDKPSSVQINRTGSGTFIGAPNGVAQMIRQEAISDPSKIVGLNLASGEQGVLVYGYRGHATIPDTDIKKGDWYISDGFKVTVIDIKLDTRVSLQAIGKAIRI